MLNFDGDCDANVNCGHTLTPVGITDVAHPGFVMRGVCLAFWLHLLHKMKKNGPREGLAPMVHIRAPSQDSVRACEIDSNIFFESSLVFSKVI